ncbi:hypothetical protein IM660_00510 [Ruania alkalisoli]|uniref:DUF4258 domain-containing protein n=1 Tax=Ruania alkalisoli TaxID=2779775 RepID=A0A7M1STF2_9MICO|nr:hypothetical protein [Ruania alkalisoli]QOR70840.1 hypothetical protein IM660_00510 [Ruania alkalisoli]
MRFTASAFRHGITQRQIETALQVPMRMVDQGGDLRLIIGATESGNLLEIVMADPEAADERVIHAMPLRPKFYRYL